MSLPKIPVYNDLLAITYRVNHDGQFAYFTVLLGTAIMFDCKNSETFCDGCKEDASDAGKKMLQEFFDVDPSNVEVITAAEVASFKPAFEEFKGASSTEDAIKKLLKGLFKRMDEGDYPFNA